MPEVLSPLRYPGGKTILLPIFQRILSNNKYSCFIETHCGGAGLSLALIANKAIENVIICDKDPLVAAFWKEVLSENVNSLIDKINKTPINMESYIVQKQIYKDYRKGKKISQIDKAFCFLFRNRTNRSGLIKAGPIGGLNQEKSKEEIKYPVHVRFNKEVLINKILRINFYKKKNLIKFKQLDSLIMIDRYIDTIGSLFYIDPPYYKVGKELYDLYYDDDDHKELNEKLNQFKSKMSFLLSYDFSEEIKKMYNTFKYVLISKNSHVANAKKQKEFLFHSHDIEIPIINSKIPVIERP